MAREYSSMLSHGVLAKHIKTTDPIKPLTPRKASFPLPPKIPGIPPVTAAAAKMPTLPKPKKLPRAQGGGGAA